MLELSYSFVIWLKALHIIAVIAWMAGLLYLPRLFVYHLESSEKAQNVLTFVTMERKLLRFIMNPSAAVVFFSGAVLLATLPKAVWLDLWVWCKLALVIALYFCHGLMARWRKELETGNNQRTGGFFRIFNEIPALIMVGVVILAVVKPF